MVNGESEEERSDPLSGLGRSTDVGGVIIFFDGNADLEDEDGKRPQIKRGKFSETRKAAAK